MSWTSNPTKRGEMKDAREKINAKLRQKDARNLIQANRKRNLDARGSKAGSHVNTVGDARKIINKRQILLLPLKDRTMLIPQRTVKNDLYSKKTTQSARPAKNKRTITMNSSGKDEVLRKHKTIPQPRSWRRRSNNSYNTSSDVKNTKEVSPDQNIFYDSKSGENLSTQLSPLQGFKLQVRNLHPSVNNDDLYELFSSVGRLRQCRLLKPGMGEVVYHEREDAVNAISQFNTRELDGKPMTVQLVTSSLTLASAIQKRTERQSQAQSSPEGMEVEYETVTKALFNVSSQPNVRRPVNFVVNM